MYLNQIDLHMFHHYSVQSRNKQVGEAGMPYFTCLVWRVFTKLNIRGNYASSYTNVAVFRSLSPGVAPGPTIN